STKLKEIYIIRYADDFKILCRTRNQAIKTKIAVEKFLKERLQLDCSEDKSKVVNLKKNWSDFLGFQLKVKAKGYKETKQWAKTNVK
ncbi:reverse transcriptase domain-containing protein, partial [Acinetobacter baumannii]